MTGSILLGVGCFALGAVVGFYGCLVVTAHAIAHNTRGVRDTVEKAIKTSKGHDRAERAMQSMLDELKAKKVQQ